MRIWEENCSNSKVKILPEVASENAKQRLGDLGFIITLKEVGQDKFVYGAVAEKQVKLFGLIKTNAKISVEVDAETGEVTKVHKPWWSFMASGF